MWHHTAASSAVPQLHFASITTPVRIDLQILSALSSQGF
jgi:hypothetical protein